ncbi:MAG: type I restriction enzyme HsdR N-terminal domain-containing protein, partial [Prevotella sp.]|nr:type I restriction enzyme HsdR N-terminal domain-containing protein [Prevotella sp.]
MINKDNFILVLRKLGFEKSHVPHIYSKTYSNFNCTLKADLLRNEPIYPDEIKSDGDFTKNFKQPESYVVFVCVAKLLGMGYRPEHIFLEKKWTLGHTQKSGRADISVFDKTGQDVLLIIECKQAGTKYQKARKDLFENIDGKQLFSYKAQARSAKWLQLYAADYDEERNEIIDFEEIVKSHDDKNIETIAKDDPSVLLYKNASEAPDIYRVWDETYNKKTYKGLIFGKDTQAYKIGIHPLRKKDLRRFNKEDGISNGFQEILRHNSISDKENAFNKLLSLFICKLVDEKEHVEEEVVDFQYKEGTDDYFTLYERLLRLFHYGMDKFLKED